MKLTYKQQQAFDFLRSKGGSYSVSADNISFDGRSMKSLVKKGLVEVLCRSRLRTDDMETVYWHVYSIVKTDLEKALL